jgi:hypothetical protein
MPPAIARNSPSTPGPFRHDIFATRTEYQPQVNPKIHGQTAMHAKNSVLDIGGDVLGGAIPA